MIALDANILIYAYRKELPDHSRAPRLLTRLANGDEPWPLPWPLPWPCVYEFLRVITHHRVFDPPTDLDKALADVESLLISPSLVLLGEGPSHARHLRSMLHGGRATGNVVHDAHIAALFWNTESASSARWTAILPAFRESRRGIRWWLTERGFAEGRGQVATRRLTASMVRWMASSHSSERSR